MSNFVLFVIISAFLFRFSAQENNNEFLCAKNICDCEQNIYENIPLFKVDCSRLNWKKCPLQNSLPKLLGYLDLSHNKIPFLDKTSQFSSLTLYYLDISHNQIKFIHKTYFHNLPQVIHLNLGHNMIKFIDKNLFYKLDYLKHINLQSNQIQSLSDQTFNHLPALEQLILSDNSIGGFLQTKKLSDLLPNTLLDLLLDQTNIKNVSRVMFDDLEHLQKLSIAYNPFPELPYLPLNNLKYLDISGTNITNLTSKNLMFPYVKVLKMNRLVHITKIYDYTFYNLHDLEELYMEYCLKLEEIHPLAFGYLREKDSPNYLSLRKFSVAYSGLQSLSDSFQFIFENLEKINLRGNFWDCTCNIKWFIHMKKNLQNINEIRCNSPKSQQNKTIFSMSDDEFSCFEKKKSSSRYVPIQTWLFPLIGVLTIIIFILIAILIYMGSYSQRNYKVEGKEIGPDSPYNPITIYPNQAENFKI